ncbi:hypothetical protein APS56_02165 [Pseudalgibacter alginicilyticus]|uniref:SGNH hydrolase-type esterase domain-containing protein n=1 Tax=Pseudalgibacter alginicilyticus TaxID=1736674 RepID=A0A0P0CUM1_9FLAO|nr:hypothetical protein [Pseudalgibacter alginicilyticus]ALJ04031.1 hypothetical protein APS56_02165 [Pseudalgibacter alginicilyticus]
MKKYLINSILFLFLILGLITIGLLLPNTSQPRSIDYSLLKKHEILNTTKEPKIVLTGGSNVLFGFNSKIIADSLKMPVVNHAIHAGYGLKYIMDDLLPYIKNGDIVILAPEYSHFLDNNRLGNEPILFSLTVKPNNIKLLSLHQTINIATFVPKFSFDKMKSFVYGTFVKSKKSSSNVYTEFSINSNGDNNSHWSLENQKFEPYKFSGSYNEKSIELLLNYNNIINNKGASLYITYPSLCKTGYLINEVYIKQIEKKLKTSNLKILGIPSDFVFPDNYFFDTAYHLNGKGVIKRSQIQMNLIKNK